MKMKFLLILTISPLLLLGACSPKNPQSTLPPPPRVDYYNHSIEYQGETLAMIAKWYTGSAANWQNILEHNHGLDPRRLKIGMNVRIPRHLLIKEKPMPKPSVTTTVAGIDQGSSQQPSTESDTTSIPQSDTAKIQEDALKLQEQALKESEQARDEAQTAAVNSQGYIDESISEPSYPSNEDLGSIEPPPLPQIDDNSGTQESGTQEKASMTDLLKKMLGGKQQQQDGASDTSNVTPPDSNTSSDTSPPSLPPANEGKVKSRDELLKELTQDY